MSSFLSKVLDLIMEGVPAKRVMALLMDERDRVIFKESRPISMIEDDELRLEIVKRVIRTKNPMAIEDLRTEAFGEIESTNNHHNPESVLCVPFSIEDKLWGAICLERNDGSKPFSDQNLELLIAFLKPIRLILGQCVDFRSFKQMPSKTPEPLLVGESRAFHRLLALIEKVKDREAPVFICGESGTGKELVAMAIHQRGARKKRKFVAVNCGAIPELLLESELFGYAKGAFTGAVRDKPGLIEEADGGTFFLDEIGDLSPHLQAKLLRLLEGREIRRIGENWIRRLNVRFISATNKNIEEEIERGNFREDLYYRLKIFTIELSPLRERKEDILSLLNYFLEKYCKKMNREKAYFSPQALELLLAYEWPGNVRELQSEIQRCLILSGEDCLIREDCLSFKINPQRRSYSTSSSDFSHARAEFEKRFLNQALARWKYNRTKTAEEIGLTRQGLFKLIKKHNINLSRKETK